MFFLNSKPCDNFIARQRFLPDGVIALLPLSNQLSSIVWSTNTDKVKQLLQSSEMEFIDAVNDAFVSTFWNNSKFKEHVYSKFQIWEWV